MMNRPDDSELEDYLAGDSAVSRAYREGAGETPPRELDARILAAGRDAVRKRRAAWIGPVAVAATLVLALGVVLRLQYGARPPAEAPATAEAPAADASAETLARRERSAADSAALSGDLVASSPSPEVAEEEARASAGAEAERPAQDVDFRESPEAWLAHVRELLAADERAAAIESLEEFRREYPDHELEPELAGLLAAGDGSG